MEESEVLFSLFGLDVTSQVTTMWGITLIVAIVCLLATRNLKDRPGPLQTALEMGIGKLRNFFADILGEENAAKYFPFLGSLFVAVLLFNYVGILPGMGYVPGLAAPSSSLSVTVGLALCVFCMTHYYGVRANGLKGYLHHFVTPAAFMLPLLLIEEIVRPVSLSLRLYGNIFGEETVMHKLYELFPVGPPILMMVLSLLFCAIQAIVFSMLASIYIHSAVSEEH